MKHYDLMIIGAGPAGVMAARSAAAEGLSVLVIEKGARLASRRDLAAGWFGHGLHTFDRLEAGRDNTDMRRVLDFCRAANGGRLEERRGRGTTVVGPHMRLLPCAHYRMPPKAALKVAAALQAETEHAVKLVFGAEVRELRFDAGMFVAVSDCGTFSALRCLLASGSRSAEWIRATASSLGLEILGPSARLGVRVEVPTRLLRSLMAKQGDIAAEHGDVRFDDARFGGFVGEWEGSGVVSAFGHTLPGKRSERTNFMAGFEAGDGFAEAVRTARIINVLSNDKVRREHIRDFMEGRSVLKHLPQFERLGAAFAEFDRLVPRFTAMAIIHVPEAHFGGALSADNSMRTKMPGLYGAGQCVNGVSTLLDAMASGLTAARSILEDKDE